LGSPIIIDKIEIDSPTVIARQDSTGALVLPIEKKPSIEASPSQPETKPLLLSLPEIYLRNANVSVYADDKSVLFAAKNANLQVSYAKAENGQQAKGSLKVQKITLAPGLSITDISSPLAFNGNKLTLDKLQGAIYGGALMVDASLDLNPPPAVFGIKVKVSKADLGGMLADLGSDPSTIVGKLDLNFEGNGNLDEPKSLAGKGDLLISNPVIGKLKSYQNLINLIGTIGGVSALKEGEFDDIKTTFAMTEQKLDLNPLEVNSKNLSINLNGPLGFDKSLDLKGDVILAPGLLQVVQTVETIIGAVNAIKNPDTPQPAESNLKIPGQIKWPVTISGFTDDPKITVSGGNSASPATTPETEKNQNLIEGLSGLLNKKNFPGQNPAPAQEQAPAPAQAPTLELQ
jgi:hypothetical protein